MPNMTFKEARGMLASFLQDTGCYDICAKCPYYPGGEGCCLGCPSLMRGEDDKVTGCGNPNLSCLSYTCAALNENLRRQGMLEGFVAMVVNLPREGYRGCQRRGDGELIQIQDPLAGISILSASSGSPAHTPAMEVQSDSAD